MSSEKSWLALERRDVWHPYASMKDPIQAYAVKRAQGVELEFEDG